MYALTPSTGSLQESTWVPLNIQLTVVVSVDSTDGQVPKKRLLLKLTKPIRVDTATVTFTCIKKLEHLV